MKRRYLLTALMAVVCSLSVMAQDYLWFKPTDRFAENVQYRMKDVDSVVFLTSSMRMYSDTLKLKFTTKTYKTDGVYQFADPGRIIYKPAEFSALNFTKETSRWCFQRSKESEHFIVFWESGFGLDPKKSSISLDVDLVLKRAEMLFDFYANRLGFIEPGNSRSTDKYKIEIFVNYDSDWLATGSGYDDKIGALWCTPSALAASGGHTIGHEIGHSFQYLVSCDLGTNHGWRWGYGTNGAGGCAWWESCAQWQGYKVYPEQQFGRDYYNQSITSAYKNLMHEDWRYANYFIQDYWCQLYGEKFIGQLWRASTFPEDPIDTYKRINNISQDDFNKMFFDYACRAITWDIDGIRDRGKSYQNAFTTKLNYVEGTEKTYQVDERNCPQNYGMNIMQLKGITPGTTVKAAFKGIAGAEGYRAINVARAGWRYGFVAQLTDGSRVYGDMYKDKEGVAEMTLPENTERAWFVVTGAPTVHWHHPWDDSVDNDEQWPYQVTFDNCGAKGTSRTYTDEDFPEDYVRKDTTVVIDATIARDAVGYSAVRVQFDTDAISEALGLSTAKLKTVKATSTANPRFAGVNSNGTTLVYAPLTTTSFPTTSTAADRKYGFWYSSAGSVCDYGGSSYVFAEWYPDLYVCDVGQYPGRLVSGRTYKVRQAIVYRHTDGKTYKAIMEVHLTAF